MAGFAAIGLWLVGLNLAAPRGKGWPQSLVLAGLVIGGIMALGLAGSLSAAVPLAGRQNGTGCI